MYLFAIILTFILSQNVFEVHAATTQPPTNDTTNATTSATTPPAVTTPPPPTTTTLPPTTTIAPTQPRTVIGETEVGQCLCDLTGNECDINCCCDPSCTAVDIAAFTCNSVSVVVDDKVCYQKEIFLFTNSPATTVTTSNGLFCIYYDNYQTRNYYLDPDFIQDFPSFREYLDRYSTASLQQPVQYVEPVYTLDSFYKTGDPIYIMYPNQARGYMVFPSTLGSSECNDQNPMPYLTELTTECTRIISTLTQTSCQTTDALSAAAYYLDFRVVMIPGLFGYVVNGTFTDISTTAAPVTTPVPAPTTTPGVTSNVTTAAPPATTTTPPIPTTVDPDLIQNLYNNPYTLAINVATPLCRLSNDTVQDCGFNTPPNATFDANSCNNVVLEARYVVTVNGTAGIARMEVQFVLGSITQASLPLSQTFSVTYNSVSDSNVTTSRSGNPGYIIGKPLRYGELISSTSIANVVNQAIVMRTDPMAGLTMVRALGNGECPDATSRDSRVLVKFGENMRTGCLIRLSLSTISGATTCSDIQRRIVETLEGPDNTPTFDSARNVWVDNNRYVATFGNTGLNTVGDWVKVLVDGRPIPSDAKFAGVPVDTCRLKMGLHIQVLYSNVGALANPQPKIIGVALLYDSIKDVKFRCTGAFCQADTQDLSQAFEVSQTVSFVDVSQPAVKYQGEAPIFIAKVPNDFFYPFLYYTSGALPSGHLCTAATLLVSLLVTMFLNRRYVLL